MCSADGTEQCETWDIGLCEVHVTADVAYAMDRYVQATGDAAFLRDYAAGVYGETARYWLSRLTWEPGRGCFSSFFVKGPDEYCGAAVNNTYTNWMARHNLSLAARHGGLGEAETQRMRHAMEHIAILYDRERRLYLQDETFERLEPAPFLKGSDVPSYKAVCFDRMQRYRVIKQADLVLLTALFPDSFTAEEKENVFHAYEPLTLHDSTLSWGIHALLALRLGMWDKAGTYFRKALLLDLKDLMGNTGHEGIHMAALGAAWQAVVYGMAGLWADESGLSVRPMLPPGIRRLRFKVHYHGERYHIEVKRDGHEVRREGA
jgi:trehalose/maltose hydrolase-like predicted phosphorylase